jgi:hypothetical protein
MRHARLKGWESESNTIVRTQGLLMIPWFTRPPSKYDTKESKKFSSAPQPTSDHTREAVTMMDEILVGDDPRSFKQVQRPSSNTKETSLLAQGDARLAAPVPELALQTRKSALEEAANAGGSEGGRASSLGGEVLVDCDAMRDAIVPHVEQHNGLRHSWV